MMRGEGLVCIHVFLFCRRTSGIRAWLSQRYNRGEKRELCNVEAVYQNLITIPSLFIQLHADGKFLQPQNFSEAPTAEFLLKYFPIYI